MQSLYHNIHLLVKDIRRRLWLCIQIDINLYMYLLHNRVSNHFFQLDTEFQIMKVVPPNSRQIGRLKRLGTSLITDLELGIYLLACTRSS